MSDYHINVFYGEEDAYPAYRSSTKKLIPFVL